MSNPPTAPVPAKVSPSDGATPAVAVVQGDVTTSDAVSDIIDLPTGKELSELGATSLAMSRPVRLVVVAGPVGCGKTTLLTSLYEQFQSGPVSDHVFAGSNTLPAFERRCFLSRIASEREVPDTERTPYGEARYLHLRVCHNAVPRSGIDLLFTDVSGESFERARDSVSECQRLSFLKRTDHFLLLLDSEKLVRNEKRWGVAHESMTLLQSCLDGGMLGKGSLVTILWAKFDYIVAAENKTHHDTFRADVKKEFEERFGARVAQLRFSEIAARPTQRAAKLQFGHGLPELLRHWTETCPREKQINLIPNGIAGDRESQMFALRHFQIPDNSQ